MSRSLYIDHALLLYHMQDGDTALIVSARNNDTALVALLLDSGADPDLHGHGMIISHPLTLDDL